MTVSISGLTFTKNAEGSTANENYACFVGYGTYTAADFTITASDGLGFTPKKVRLINLTDAKEVTYFVNSGLGTSNAEGLLVANHDTAQAAYAAAGLTVATNSLTVDVSAGATITDNDDFVIECWG